MVLGQGQALGHCLLQCAVGKERVLIVTGAAGSSDTERDECTLL